MAALLALALAGCGGGGESSSAGGDTSGTVRNAPAHSEQDVIDALQLTSDNGISYTDPNGCEVAVVLIGKNTVNLYSGAGDTVATNPAGDVGVKVVSNDPSCASKLAAGLKGL
ncbi:hypothetical protein [Candidatus Solirubrobacter pratensis]|uniref:hypothetical protein n=1 Tax=Candidatus Solirubrobacter pratensis TaxID=1298857 RepID=UPI000481A03D|nr:hypothetical protein [Candidatus Solirubrobacter pratensis]